MKRRNFLTHLIGGAATTLGGINSEPVISYAYAKSVLNYASFLSTIYQQAIQQGMNAKIMKRALNFSTPNAKVIQLDRKQPEFTLTWQQYYQKVITPAKIEEGRKQFNILQSLLTHIWQKYQIDPSIIVGIWGIESYYGKYLGKFNVIDALATLAYEGKRVKFFKTELMNALKILDHRSISPENMTGSYAGAMGQPQFMPSAYLQYAVDFSGNNQPNIWTNKKDILASIANYLNKNGWHASEPWGQKIQIPNHLTSSLFGHHISKTLREWRSLGVVREDGSEFNNLDIYGSVLKPNKSGSQAFMVYRNFNIIRRYNPSDYYALAVGLLRDAIVS